MPGYKKTGGSVFDRLYSTPTKSSALKTNRPFHAGDDDTASTVSKETPKSPSPGRRKKPNSLKAVSIPSSRSISRTRGAAKTTLLVRSASKSTPTVLKPAAVRLSSDVSRYEAGKLSKSEFASRIISSLFHRDFSTEKPQRWDEGSAEIVPGQSTDVFDCKKESTYDWKDTYSVASAKATVRFEGENVFIEGYNYYVAG